MEKFLQEVGARVKEARMRKHLSQAQLADLLGLTPPYISNIETGKQNMSITALAKISDVLEVSADWLLRNNTADALAITADSEAYQVLAETHDASKGAYQRVFKTGLDSERLEAYFAEFCARTYMAEQFEVTDDAAKEIFNNLKEVKRHRESGIQFSSFMSDICDNLCLMYHENGKYHFMHRSFQEYFCALFFSRQMDDTLPAIANEFEKKRRRYGTDSTFGMLYDMITEKVEKKVFIPFLEDLFAKCDRKYGYWTFLEKVYPTIRYHVDNIGEDRVHQHPSSFLYDFISRVSGKRRSDEEGWREMPFIDSLIVKKYISLPVVVIDEDTNESQMWTEVFRSVYKELHADRETGC